jgi:lipopolysaccharide biosynthesis glycosyltransferase
MNVVHAVLCADQAFSPHVRVCLASIMDSASTGREYRVWIVSECESHEVMAFSTSGLNIPRNFTLRPVRVHAGSISNAPVSKGVSLASYYRLFAPLALPVEVDRYVYLDCDVIVRRDVADLFDFDLRGCTLGAVVNSQSLHNASRLGLSPSAKYLNAGVLLIDRRKWVAERISERALELVRSKPEVLKFWDQDAINVTVDGRWIGLPLEWNQQAGFWELRGPSCLGINRQTWRKALENPAIIHYSGACKPWHYACDHPQRWEYLRYRSLVDGRNLTVTPRHFAEWLRRQTKRFVPFVARPYVRPVAEACLLPIKMIAGKAASANN